MKFKKNTFYIETSGGTKRLSGLVSPCGLFGIDRDKKGRGWETGVWTVTHIPTGLRASDFYYLAEARAFVKAILPLTDWTSTNSAMYSRIGPDVVRERNRILLECGNKRSQSRIVPQEPERERGEREACADPTPIPGAHPSVTRGRVYSAARASISSDEYIGICTHCGADFDGIEPDAVGYTCDECGHMTVCGAEHLLLSHVA